MIHARKLVTVTADDHSFQLDISCETVAAVRADGTDPNGGSGTGTPHSVSGRGSGGPPGHPRRPGGNSLLSLFARRGLQKAERGHRKALG